DGVKGDGSCLPSQDSSRRAAPGASHHDVSCTIQPVMSPAGKSSLPRAPAAALGTRRAPGGGTNSPSSALAARLACCGGVLAALTGELPCPITGGLAPGPALAHPARRAAQQAPAIARG